MLVLNRATAVILILYCITPAWAGKTPAPKNAVVHIIWPADGKTFKTGKLWVRMGLRNAGIAPRGVNIDGVGHHHLLIDTELPPLDQEIPSDRNHLHYGGGQTEARLIDLAPGKHSLQLLFGDHDHIPHDPPLFSEKITITVLPYD